MTPPDTVEIESRLLSAPLFSWDDLAGNRVLPPARPGIYAWFFRTLPGSVPSKGCYR